MFQYGQGSPLRVTFALILSNVLVYGLLQVGGLPVLLLLAQTGQLFFAGCYWQLVTAMFVHFSILHLLFNMYGLFYFGRLNESAYEPRQYLTVYFGAGILGNVASLFLIGPTTYTGGASGAIFGLVGSYVARERKGVNMAMAVVYAVLIFIASSGPDVNIYAHLFGALGGFALGSIFTHLSRQE